MIYYKFYEEKWSANHDKHLENEEISFTLGDFRIGLIDGDLVETK